MKVMVVDDSSTIRKLIKAELKPSGYVILEAQDGVEALEILRTTPDIRLITLDLEMPAMDGFRFLERIRDPLAVRLLTPLRNEKVPVVFLTSVDTDETRHKGFKLGVADFVAKPFVKGELLAVADSLLKPHIQFKGLSAVVADANPASRSIAASCLKQLGVTVSETDDGVVAFQSVAGNPGGTALVITDLSLRSMNGDELCGKMRGELGMKDTPVIFLAEDSGPGMAIRLFKAGATDYLRKPFIKEELSARLQVHLERVRLNNILRQNVSELKRLGKLKDDFLAVCSHDLQSPLSAVLGASELLLSGSGLTEEQRRQAEVIRVSVSNSISFIRELLALGKAEASREDAHRTPLALADILRACVAMFEATAREKGVVLSLQNTAEGSTVMAGRNDMTRIFNNLISNALKFTLSGGRVDVAVSSPDGNTVRVCVKDTGIGIPEDTLDRLFEKYTVSSRTGTAGEHSTGLGLSICRELVERHGGSVEVRSSEGEGAIFTVTLPALS